VRWLVSIKSINTTFAKTAKMKAVDIKSDILKKIEGLNAVQLKQVYCLFLNYMGSNADDTTISLPSLKQKLSKAISEADRGAVKPIEVVTSRLRRKYGIGG